MWFIVEPNRNNISNIFKYSKMYKKIPPRCKRNNYIVRYVNNLKPNNIDTTTMSTVYTKLKVSSVDYFSEKEKMIVVDEQIINWKYIYLRICFWHCGFSNDIWFYVIDKMFHLINFLHRGGVLYMSEQKWGINYTKK